MSCEFSLYTLHIGGQYNTDWRIVKFFWIDRIYSVAGAVLMRMRMVAVWLVSRTVLV